MAVRVSSGMKRIVVAGIDDVGAETCLQQAAESECNVEHDVLLHHAVRTDSSGIVSTVACVDHNAPNLQAKRAGQVRSPIAVGVASCVSGGVEPASAVFFFLEFLARGATATAVGAVVG